MLEYQTTDIYTLFGIDDLIEGKVYQYNGNIRTYYNSKENGLFSNFESICVIGDGKVNGRFIGTDCIYNMDNGIFQGLSINHTELGDEVVTYVDNEPTVIKKYYLNGRIKELYIKSNGTCKEHSQGIKHTKWDVNGNVTYHRIFRDMTADECCTLL